MSDRDPMVRFDPEAPDADDVHERHVALRAIKRMRSVLVLGPLVVLLLVAASIGAAKLWADPPERDAVSAVVTCWNGEELPSEECTEPTGPRGLRWVFPSFRPRDCDDITRENRPAEFLCTTTLDQRRVTILYTARSSTDQALEFLEKSYGAPPEEDPDSDQVVWRSEVVDEDGDVRMTAAYAEHPFSVTVRAPTEELRDTAFDELVQLRPADELRVRS